MSSLPSETPAKNRMTTVQWLICIIAAIGFLFDTYELLMLQVVGRFALQELGVRPGTDEFRQWLGMLFYIPAFAGGIFGLLGGYLTDYFGRRRVLTYSILMYAISAFLAAFSTNLWLLLLFRCGMFVGVCIEFVAAVAWLAELFPDPKRREKVIGYTQAFASFGGLLLATVNGILASHAAGLPALPNWFSSFAAPGTIFGAHAPWRYTLMSGLLPAIPLIIIRPFLPESPVWKEKKQAGTLRRPSIAALFSPQLRRTTIVTTILVACSYGVAFGAIQQIQQMIPGLPQVKNDVAAAMKAPLPATQKAIASAGAATTRPATGPAMAAAKKGPDPRIAKAKQIEQEYSAGVTQMQELGGLAGRTLLAILATVIIARAWLLRSFQIPGLIIIPLAFAWAAVTDLTALKIGIFLVGLVNIAQFSFWGNYLPRVYPLHLRGTGESFAANIGGRMIGTSFAWVTTTIAGASFWQGYTDPQRFAYTAAIVATSLYVIGIIVSFFLPEPPKEMEEDAGSQTPAAQTSHAR